MGGQRVSWDHAPCCCASTNHSHLSTPREISVRMSALAASSSSFISSMPTRTVRPNMASASDSAATRSEEHTSELQSPCNLVCRLLLEKKKKKVTIVMLPLPHSTVNVPRS